MCADTAVLDLLNLLMGSLCTGNVEAHYGWLSIHPSIHPDTSAVWWINGWIRGFSCDPVTPRLSPLQQQEKMLSVLCGHAPLAC